jgi:hydroxypyruvate isomerase
MPKFAANLGFLFADVPFPARFARAAAAGFSAVETLFPYDYAACDIAQWLRAANLELVLFNLAPGDWAGGERGLACLPDRRSEFAESVEQALDYALALGCRRLHCLSGLRPAADEALLEETYIANLRYAADRLASIGATLMIEPINSRIDMPGYWLDDVDKAFRLQKAIGRSNLEVQYDIYHAVVMGDDPLRRLADHIVRIGHVQIADSPGRHEPGSGKIDFPALFELLERLGYSGWVGCEYRPTGLTENGLGWLPASARRRLPAA